MGFLSSEKVKALGLRAFGDNVLISDKANIYNAENITIGSHVRIDDFSLLSAGDGGISIGNFVHISAYSSLVGAEKITFEDFSGVSSKVSVFSSSDNYMGYGMTNPTVPDEFKRVKSLPVTLKKHALVGAHSILLPGTVLGEGVSIGAMSVVSSVLEEWFVYMGNPAKKISRRSKQLLEQEKKLKEHFHTVDFN